MRKLRWKTAILTISLLAASAGLFFAGAQALTKFLPPRTAVIDIAVVFEDYQKRKDRASELKSTYDAVVTEIGSLKDELQIKERSLQDLKPGSEGFRREYLEHLEIAAKLKELQETKGKEFEEKRSAFLDEIRKEIKKEVEVFAQAEEIDLVLEKAVTADNPRSGIGFQWSIVHYSKPELDITKQVTDRLNERYKRPQ